MGLDQYQLWQNHRAAFDHSPPPTRIKSMKVLPPLELP
jgi:hypothetical protein